MSCRLTTVKIVTVGVLAAAGALDTARAATVATSCEPSGYSYAGFQDMRLARGVRATIVALGRPEVEAGHVAAWIGVGGRGLGPGGKDEWLQVGVGTFTDDAIRLYFEVNRPGVGPRFTELRAGVPTGLPIRVAVVELAALPGRWQVRVNGAPASDPIPLPGSSGRWQPIVTAETWDGATADCNRFAYRFERVEVLPASGGGWVRLTSGLTFLSCGCRLHPRDRDTFVAEFFDPR